MTTRTRGLAIGILAAITGMNLPTIADEITFENLSPGPHVGAAYNSGTYGTWNVGPQSLPFKLSDGNVVTFNGGEILTAASYSSADESTIYWTARGLPGLGINYSLDNPITIKFQHPVHDLSLDLFNGETISASYSVTTFAAGSPQASVTTSIWPNWVSGRELVGFSSSAGFDTVTVTGPDAVWDFDIDNIIIGEPLPGALHSQSAPDWSGSLVMAPDAGSTLLLMGAAMTGLALSRRILITHRT